MIQFLVVALGSLIHLGSGREAESTSAGKTDHRPCRQQLTGTMTFTGPSKQCSKRSATVKRGFDR